ncbi:MAG: hypothetical protein J6P32_04290 [Stomatobaculum sp.]|nr:hypothetical protein [Stomatobaculum sp.]
MKINTKKLAAGPVMAAALLCAVSVGVNAPGISNVYAATVTESTGTSQTKRPEKGSQRGQNGEKPEEKGTRYVGKITSLTSSTITVELGEMKQKEKPAEGTSGTKPEKPADGTSGTRQKKSADSTDAAAGAAKDSAKEKKDLNPEDFITLTGETKTITVTDSTKFRSRGKKNADGTETADTAGEFTISDLAAGDYITFLADEEGSILEVSKGIGMGGRGRHGGPQDDRKQKETTAAAQ